MNSDQLGPVRESSFDLDLGDHLGDAVHDLGARNYRRAITHQFRDLASIPSTFNNIICDQRNGFRMVELNAPLQTACARQSPPSRPAVCLFRVVRVAYLISLYFPDPWQGRRQAGSFMSEHFPELRKVGAQRRCIGIDQPDDEEPVDTAGTARPDQVPGGFEGARPHRGRSRRQSQRQPHPSKGVNILRSGRRYRG